MAREEFLKPFRLAEILRPEISEIEEHQPIPTQRQLAERFGVSRVSVRQALNLLQSEGLIYSVHGSGTYVSPPRNIKQMRLLSFNQEMLIRGMKPESKVIDLQLIRDPKKIHEEWVAKTEPMYRIERVRMGDAEPISLEVTYIGQSIAPELESHDLTGSLYEILKQNYNQEIVSADEELKPIVLTSQLSNKLDVARGTLGFEFRRRGFNVRGQEIENTRTIRRGDRWDFKYTVRA